MKYAVFEFGQGVKVNEQANKRNKKAGRIDSEETFDNSEVSSAMHATTANGEFISLLGPAGCGKTTFLRIIANFEQASTGEARLAGSVIKGLVADGGFVFKSDDLLP